MNRNKLNMENTKSASSNLLNDEELFETICETACSPEFSEGCILNDNDEVN